MKLMIRFGVSLVVLSWHVVACTPQTQLPLSIPVPTVNNDGLSSNAIVTPTIENTESPSPTPITTLVPLTPTPDPILQFTQLVQLGRGTVEQIGISPDGRWLIALGNQRVRLYEASTLAFVRSLVSDGLPITAVSWGPDSQHVAVAGEAQTIRFWDVETGEQTKVIAANDGLAVSALAWSPVDEQIAVLGHKGGQSVIQIWEWSSGDVLSEFEVTNAEQLVWSPDGTRIAFYRFQFLAWLDLSQPVPKPTLITNLGVGPIHSVAWSPDGDQLAAGSGEPNPFGSSDYTVRVWEVGTNKPNGILRHEWMVPLPATNVAWSPNGQWVAAGTENRTIHLWTIDTGEALSPLEGHGAGVVSIAWLADSQQLFSAGRDGTIRQWSVERSVQIRSAGDERVSPPLTLDVAWSPDGKQIALAGQDGTVQLWDTTTWEQVTVLIGHRGAVNGVAWSPDGRQLASGGDDGYLRIWDVAKGQVFMQLPQLGESKGRITSVAWQPNAERFVATGGFPLQVWDPASGDLVWEAKPDFLILRVEWSANSQLAIARDAASVQIVEARSGREITESNLSRTVNSFAWSPYGSQLLLGTGFGKTPIVHILDLTANSETDLKTDLQEIMSVAWSPDAQWWALGDNTGVIHLWAVEQSEFTLALIGHTTAITDLSWSPDGTRLASSSADGTVRIWGIP